MEVYKMLNESVIKLLKQSMWDLQHVQMENQM